MKVIVLLLTFGALTACGGGTTVSGKVVFTDGYTYCQGEIACGVVKALK